MVAAAARELPSLTNRDEVTASIVGKTFSVNMSGFEASSKQESREVVASDCQFDSGKKGYGGGNTLREQKKDVTEFLIFNNSDGLLTFYSTWPNRKLKKGSEIAAGAAAPLGKHEGSVPLIMESIANFHKNDTMDFDKISTIT